jgi:hypothetical protein
MLNIVSNYVSIVLELLHQIMSLNQKDRGEGKEDRGLRIQRLLIN